MHTSTMISALRNVEKRPTRPVCDYPPPARSPALLETTPEPARAGGCTIGIVSNLRGCNARGVNILYPRRGYFRCVSTYRLLIPFVRLVLSAVSDRSTINRPSSHSKIIRKDLSRAKSEDHWGRTLKFSFFLHYSSPFPPPPSPRSTIVVSLFVND